MHHRAVGFHVAAVLADTLLSACTSDSSTVGGTTIEPSSSSPVGSVTIVTDSLPPNSVNSATTETVLKELRSRPLARPPGLIPLAIIPTTVATGMRRPRMQGTHPICMGLTVIRSTPKVYQPADLRRSWRLRQPASARPSRAAERAPEPHSRFDRRGSPSRRLFP